ncbi:Protein STRUBBELIG-RECEPTOR FAMILY 3 [Rhynchospora pubera]|uniref:Protein STRUBBELIG-RECEPTOR FAMILY 3 n=1 Tax=Rhynchospora pubera TaxID=906938 RepID=A0AAV8HMS8_9POAL|nr:Protein STRUBBELIG-RECEPTOR FAMILY 3 [Rhynchospora pubera]
MNHKRMAEAKITVNLRFILLLMFCTEIHAAFPFFPTFTNSEDVYAINKLYSALGSPSLSGWTALGGDPCYELWQGVQCTNNRITAIVLSGANLEGKLQDDSLANFTSLLTLDLSNNNIGGSIPDKLPSTLQIFSLAGNQFAGTIPSSVSYLTSISDLSLSGNLLTGVLPDAFQSLAQLVSLKLSANKLIGHLPPSMRYLTSLTTMHVQNNELSGTLEVLQTLPLKDLNIANNQFSGFIPENLLKIPNLQADGNQLNVTISPSPEQPPATSSPSPEQPPAVDGPVQQNAPPSPVYKPPVYHKRKTMDVKAIAYAVAIGSSIIIAIAILLVTICIPTWKVKRNASLVKVESTMLESTKEHDSANNTTQSTQNNQEAGKEVEEHKVNMKDLQSISADRKPANSDKTQTSQKRLHYTSSVKSFSVAILQQYTNSFSEENLIRECRFGKFYLGKDEDRNLYTVLKIEERKSKIPLNSFLRIAEDVSRIQHCNIAELLGYCAEYGQRLLVYKYYSQTTLNDILHSHDHSKRTLLFSWISRIRVALEAAKALEYLHGGGKYPIVHQQFEPCNILIDDELRVCVSGCGLASFLPFISELQQSHCPRALSYNAPEVNESGNWSVKSDVYSFGVVLLELLTGREPYDSSRPRAERHLASWASCQLHDIDALVKMVDPALGGRFPIRSLSRVADIVSRCIQEEPEFRPSMSEVVQDLIRALDADDTSNSIL